MIDRLSKAEDGRVINNFRVYFNGRDSEKAYISFGYREHAFKIYYRPERTLDDHMGNTPCGDYINLRFPNGKKERAYLY